jgi:Uma2 family endonuclease
METIIDRKVWTEEELMNLPRNGHKYELIEGDIYMSPTGLLHGFIATKLSIELGKYIQEKSLGILCDSSTGFWMKNSDLLSPDISFISGQRIREYKYSLEKFYHGSPDLVIEILSPSDNIEKISTKVKMYFENDTKLLWVINFSDETVLIYHSAQPDKILKSGDLIDGEEVVPGFSYQVSELFAEIKF